MAEEKLNFRTFTQGGLIIEVYRLYDADATFNEHNEPDRYDGVEPIERAKYEAQDETRYNAWQADEWYYLGVCVDVRIKTATNWIELPLVGRASIWGVESDSGEEYFTQLETETIDEALEDVKRLRAALCKTS